MTDDIRALLEELKKADPGTWKKIDDIFGMSHAGYNIDPDSEEGQDTIQGCIQRACASNEWALQQFQYMNQSKTCNASIFPMSGGFFEADAATPAAAILAAYLAARKAMK